MAHRRMIARLEARKIPMVISDGALLAMQAMLFGQPRELFENTFCAM